MKRKPRHPVHEETQTLFDSYMQDVLADSLTCGTGDIAFESHERQFHCAIASAVPIVAARGLEWCQANPEEFSKAVWSQLGFWAQAGILLVSLFTGGAPLWMSIITRVLPYVIKWFASRQTTGTCSAEDLTELAQAAEHYVKGRHYE